MPTHRQEITEFGRFVCGFPVRVLRSSARKKTIQIEVTSDSVLIRAPMNSSRKQIRTVLETHESWLQKTIDSRKRQQRTVDELGPLWKHSLLYQGEAVALTVAPSSTWSVRLSNGVLDIMGPDIRDEAVYQIIKLWYKKEARAIIQQRLDSWAQSLGTHYRQFRIKDQKTRWGSCSSQANLNFNWRLAAVPLDVLDYVIVHELCHLWEMNHSPRFWSRVEAILPNYRQARRWLKDHGHQLMTVLS